MLASYFFNKKPNKDDDDTLREEQQQQQPPLAALRLRTEFFWFVHMDFSHNSSGIPEYWYYALQRTVLLEESPCEVYRLNVRKRLRSPELIGHVQLGGLIGRDRLWLDRTCSNFYGICIHPSGSAMDGARDRCFQDGRAFGPDDGQVWLLRLIRHNNALQRMDLQFAGEPIKIGQWCLFGEFRWHFYFMTDNEAILVVGETEFDAQGIRMFFHSHVYRLHIDSPDLDVYFDMHVNVAHSDQIYVYLMEPLEADPNNDVDQQQKIVPLFYQVTMRHKCLVFNEVDSTWERWDDDASTHSSLPAGKYYFRRDCFDKGLLLLNSVEKCYVQLQIRPMERRCTFTRFFRAERPFWPDRKGSLIGFVPLSTTDLATEMAVLLEALCAIKSEKNRRLQQRDYEQFKCGGTTTTSISDCF